MLKKIRNALIWLMMLAIPMQGVAAATMVYCGLDHQGAGTESSLHARHAGDLASGHDANQHHTATSQGGAGVASAVVDSNAAFEAGLDLSPKIKCSVCADCSSGLAITSSMVNASSNQDSPAPVLLWVPVVPVIFVTNGPERPPRSFLA